MKIKIRFISLLLLCLLFIPSCTRDIDVDNAAEKNIALILKTSYGYHWGTLKMGAYAAAREFNINIDYTAPYDEEDVNEQIKLVDQAIEKKVDALILEASNYVELSDVIEKASERGIPVIVVDSEVDTDKIKCFIATDNFNAGKKAGNVLIDITGKESEAAILSFDRGSRNADQREKGVLSAIDKYPGIKVVSKEYCLSDTKSAYNLTKKIISENPGINSIVALNEVASEGAAQAIEESGLQGKVKIIAFNSTLQEINYMDRGVIQATIIQNPFNMGYLGVKYALDAIEKKKIEKRTYIDSKVIYRENMYLPENQKLLFSLIK